jgi:hypothetical protein
VIVIIVKIALWKGVLGTIGNIERESVKVSGATPCLDFVSESWILLQIFAKGLS